MPTRIYPVRPLLGRRRGYYGAQGNPAAAFSGGEAMGKMAGGAIMDFQKWQAQQKQQKLQDALNAQANRMENTVAPPRAGAVGPVVNPATGQVVRNIAPTTGTAPFSTGAAGMKMQQDFIRSSLENQRLAQEVRNQGIASNMAARRGGGDGGGGSGNASRWKQYLGGGGGKQGVDQYGNPIKAGKAGKPAAYVAGSSTVDTPDTYYNFDNQRKDLDSQYGSGTNNRLLGAYAALKGPNVVTDKNTGITTAYDQDPGTSDAPNAKAKPIATLDKDGNVTLSPYGQHAGAYIPAAEAKANMARYDGTLVKQGKEPRFSDQYLGTQHPESGLPNGDAANPYTPTNNGQLDAIAPGKSYVDPTDGKVYQKSAPQKPATQQPPAKATSQIDTGDQGQLASAPSLPGQQPLTLASGQPQTQQDLVAGDQGQGTDYTAGSSQLSPVVPPAPVDVAAATASNTPGSFDLGQPTSGGLPQNQQLADEIKRSQMADYLQGVA